MVFCCERMLPNFKRFIIETGFGDAAVLRRALDAIWMWIENGTPPVALKELKAACEQQAPNTENFSSPYTSAALDAANSVAIALDAIEDDDAEHVVEVASLARDTVDLYVQEQLNLDPSEAEFENKILSSPLMQRELTHQYASLERLADLGGERGVASQKLRQDWSNIQSGSLGT